MHVQLFEQQKL